MNHALYPRLLFLALLLVCCARTGAAQDWETYESETFDLQFALPAGWDTEIDGDIVTSMGNGIVFVLAAVKDATVSTRELFDLQVETLDLDAEGEYEEIELAGGIQGVIASGVAEMDGQIVGLILLAATLDENNYLAYIFAEVDAFEENEGVMVDVLTSLAPFGWVEE